MESNPYRSLWVKDKVALVSRLIQREPLGAYSEAMIIMSAVLSAMASDLWPGKVNDRLRFIETIVRFAPEHFNVRQISIPMLVTWLYKQRKWNLEAERIEQAFLNFDFTRVLTGTEVDRTEAEVASVCPHLPLDAIRGSSYANLLYEEVRCAYVHEYRPGKNAVSVPMSTREDEAVSYVNVVNVPIHRTGVEGFGPSDVDRKIHFHWQWASKLALAIASKLDQLPQNPGQEIPRRWWLKP